MWVNNAGDYVTNTLFLPGELPDPADLYPFPSAWKIDPMINGGYPYISLMIDLPRLEINPIKQREYICIFTPRTVGGHTVYPEADELLHGNGDAILLPISAEITQDHNAMWSVQGVHPIDPEGRWQYIKNGAIIRCMGQLFTVKNVTDHWAGNSGQVQFYGEHIWYQQADAWIYPYIDGDGDRNRLTATSGQAAINMINARTSAEEREGYHAYAFTGTSDVQWAASDPWTLPISSGITPIEAMLGSGGLIECKGGELYRHNFSYSIDERMEGAEDNAFDIRIGKNLTGINRVVDTTSMVSYFRAYDPYGGWFAIAWDFGAFFGDLFPHYVVRSQNYEFPDEANEDGWDYSDWFNNVFIPQATANFMKNGKPIIRYEIDLADVRQNPDFEIIRGETFRVGDKGTIWDSRLGAMPLTIEITGTVYDGIREKCKKVIIGDRQSFVQTAMPAVDWGTVPTVVGGETPILDADGNMIYDADGNLIVQSIAVGGADDG
jgi:hypothetical protein